MSIIVTQQGVQPGGMSEFALIAPMLAIGVWFAWRLGIFRGSSIVGPDRLTAQGRLETPLVAMVVGLFTWVAVPTLIGMAASHPATEPSTVPASQLTESISQRGILISSSSALLAFVAMLIASRILSPMTETTGLVLKRLGMHPGQVGRGVAYGVGASLFIIPLTFGAAVATDLVWKALHYAHPAEHDLLRMIGESRQPVLSLALLLCAVLVAPIFEELLFRGHAQTLLVYGLARAYRPSGESKDHAPGSLPRWVGAVLTAGIFAMVHPIWMAPPIFVLAVCLGYLYERTGNLWSTMTVHAGFNMTSTAFFLIKAAH